MKEKRRFIRFAIALKVNYTVQKEPKKERTGITKNVTVEGINLLTNDRLDVGNKLSLNLIIPEALNPVHLKGIVLWSKEVGSEKAHSYSAGIEFGRIEEDNKNTFLRFLCDLMYQNIETLSDDRTR